MPVDVVKLLKTQDAGYVRTLISTEEKVRAIVLGRQPVV